MAPRMRRRDECGFAPPLRAVTGRTAEARRAGSKPSKRTTTMMSPKPKRSTRQSAGRARRAGSSGGLTRLSTKGADHAAKNCAKDGSEKGEQRALGQDELDESTTAGADRDAESHLMGAGGGLRGHHVGDVDAGDEQDESGQKTEDAEVSAIVLLELGDAGPGRIRRRASY